MKAVLNNSFWMIWSFSNDLNLVIQSFVIRGRFMASDFVGRWQFCFACKMSFAGFFLIMKMFLNNSAIFYFWVIQSFRTIPLSDSVFHERFEWFSRSWMIWVTHSFANDSNNSVVHEWFEWFSRSRMIRIIHLMNQIGSNSNF